MIDAPPAPGAKPLLPNTFPPSSSGGLPQPVPPLAPAAGTGTVVSPPSGAEILAKAAEDRAKQQAEINELIIEPAMRSDTIGQLAAALAVAQGTIVSAKRDSTNPFFKSKYADLAAVWLACRASLSSNGLAVIQPVKVKGRAVIVTTLLVHSSGEWIEESLVMIAQNDTPQAVGSTITYGRRYGLAAMVGVAPEDDDGESGSRTIAPGTKWDKGATGSHQPVSGRSDELPEGPEAPGMPSTGEPATSPSEGNRPVPPVVQAPVVRAGTPAPSGAAGVRGAPSPPGRPPARAPGAPKPTST